MSNPVQILSDRLREMFIKDGISPGDALKGMSALILDIFHDYSENNFNEWLEDMADIRKKMKTPP